MERGEVSMEAEAKVEIDKHHPSGVPPNPEPSSYLPHLLWSNQLHPQPQSSILRIRDSGGVPAVEPPASTSTLKEGRGVAAREVPALSPVPASGGRCWGAEADRGVVSNLALPGTASWPSPPVKERA